MGPQRPALERQASGQQAAARRRMEPVKLFDNLYYMGFSDIGAWAITTSDGIILLDTLNSPQEADEIMVADMRKVGLDPATVKYAIIGHGHFDHFGGAPAQWPPGVVRRRDRVDGNDSQEPGWPQPVRLRRSTLRAVHRHHDRVRPRANRGNALQGGLLIKGHRGMHR